MRERNQTESQYLFVNFLEPNAANDRTIASLSKVDQLLSNFNTEETKWEAYWQACEQLFKKATGKTFSTMNYYDNPEIIIIKASERNMAQPIITLYDKLLKDDNTTPHPLLNLLIQTKSANALPIPTNRKVYCNQEHWAQMSSDFPLSISQRETLAMYTTPECADIFVVNGPPGTGKTTFLQTVIANRLAHNILNNPEEPEIIVASSANNQAITNILKDFKAETTNDTTHPPVVQPLATRTGYIRLISVREKRAATTVQNDVQSQKGMDFRQHTIHLNVKKSTNNSICNASITFPRKTIKTKQNAGNFSVKKCKPSKKRLFSVSKLPKQQNMETGRKTIYYRSLSANSMSHYPPTTK